MKFSKIKTKDTLIIIISVLLFLIVLYWLFTSMKYNVHERFASDIKCDKLLSSKNLNDKNDPKGALRNIKNNIKKYPNSEKVIDRLGYSTVGNLKCLSPYEITDFNPVATNFKVNNNDKNFKNKNGVFSFELKPGSSNNKDVFKFYGSPENNDKYGKYVYFSNYPEDPPNPKPYYNSPTPPPMTTTPKPTTTRAPTTTRSSTTTRAPTTTPSPGNTGDSCSKNEDCKVSGKCDNKKCAPNNVGGSCKYINDCSTWNCNKSTWKCEANIFEGRCLQASDCTSNNCINNQCSPTKAGGPCKDPKDCTTWSCSNPDSNNNRKCMQTNLNGKCADNNDCLSNRCTNNKCEVSEIGLKCLNDNDCKSNYCTNRSPIGQCQNRPPPQPPSQQDTIMNIIASMTNTQNR